MGKAWAEGAVVGIGGSGPVGGSVVAGGIAVEEGAVGIAVEEGTVGSGVSFVSEVYRGRVAPAGSGQSSGVSGYSMGLSSM